MSHCMSGSALMQLLPSFSEKWPVHFLFSLHTVKDESAINTPAVAAAFAIKCYNARNEDEISLEVSLLSASRFLCEEKDTCIQSITGCCVMRNAGVKFTGNRLHASLIKQIVRQCSCCTLLPAVSPSKQHCIWSAWSVRLRFPIQKSAWIALMGYTFWKSFLFPSSKLIYLNN